MGQGVECGGLNRCGPHRFMCLNACHIGSGTIRRCDLIGVGMALLEKICPCGVGFELLYAQAKPSVARSLPLLPESQELQM